VQHLDAFACTSCSNCAESGVASGFTPGDAQDFAPGDLVKSPGDAQNIAPGKEALTTGIIGPELKK
jgi:hypothetical protein